MNHLSHEDLVLSYYGEPEPGGRRDHLASCDECRNELARLAAVLDRVTAADVPEPAADYEARVWERLNWRLRAEKKRERRAWPQWVAAAAVIALAFLGGLLWNRRDTTRPVQVAQQPQPAPPSAVTPVATGATPQQQQAASRDRILLLVVGEHFDQSERVLVELTNLAPSTGDVDITTERARAEELLASNRLYRRTALDRGEGNVATLLDELEPMLLQIAHAPEQLNADELRAMQKRVESKGLVFKLRVVRADVQKSVRPDPQPNV